MIISKDEKIKILFVASDPRATVGPLRLDEERQAIKTALGASSIGVLENTRFDFQHIELATTEKLASKLIAYDPHILHISSHGTYTKKPGKANNKKEHRSGDLDDEDDNYYASNYISFQDADGNLESLSCDVLLRQLQSCKSLQCVILNLCNSNAIAEKISECVGVAIGTSISIKDKRSVYFSAGFYSALFAGGGLEIGYGRGCNCYNENLNSEGEGFYKFISSDKYNFDKYFFKFLEDNYEFSEILLASSHYLPRSSSLGKNANDFAGLLLRIKNLDRGGKLVPYVSFIYYFYLDEDVNEFDKAKILAGFEYYCHDNGIEKHEVVKPVVRKKTDACILVSLERDIYETAKDFCSFHIWLLEEKVDGDMKSQNITEEARRFWAEINPNYPMRKVSLLEKSQSDFVKMIATLMEFYGLSAENTSIDFFVDFQHFSVNFNFWADEDDELLSEYSNRPIVNRWTKRLQQGGSVKLKDIKYQDEVEIISKEDFDMKVILGKIRAGGKTSFAFDSEPNESFIKKIIVKGVPVVLWRKGFSKGLCCENFCDDFSGIKPKDLFVKVNDNIIECELDDDPDYSYILIWDDVSRLPKNKRFGIN